MRLWRAASVPEAQGFPPLTWRHTGDSASLHHHLLGGVSCPQHLGNQELFSENCFQSWLSRTAGERAGVNPGSGLGVFNCSPLPSYGASRRTSSPT